MDDLPPLDPALDPLSDLAAGQSNDALQQALLEGSALPVQPVNAVSKDDEQAARQSYITHGGNVAAVARDTGLSPRVINRMAADLDWPLYGDGDSQSEKNTKTRLRRLHDRLEMQMLELLDSLGVEEKDAHTLIEKGAGSEYVASLSQRSGAFKQVFDAYTRVGSMIAPEVFDVGSVDSSGVRQRSGGMAGADRDLADFMARVTVGIADEINRRDRGDHALQGVVEAEVIG